MLRLVMPKSNSKQEDNVEQMLQESIFFTFRILSMNWSSLLASDDVREHYEVTLQLFCSNGKQLSNKTMIPLLRKQKQVHNCDPIQWAFLQIPMQALITENLALVIEVFKVEYKSGDLEPTEQFGASKSSSSVKTLEGFSTINLSATYALSNVMGGQTLKFSRLRFFCVDKKTNKLCKISDKYSEITPSDVKMNPNSAVLT